MSLGFLKTTSICQRRSTAQRLPPKTVAVEPQQQAHLHLLFVEGGWNVVRMQVSAQKPGGRRLLQQLEERSKVTFCSSGNLNQAQTRC